MITELHVDMSGKWNQKGVSILGYIDASNNNHKSALIIKESTKKKLNKKFTINTIEHELQATCIRLLLNEVIDDVSRVIICNDYKFDKVILGLSLLFKEEQLLKIKSLNEYRIEIGNPSKRSEADGYLSRVRKHFKKNKNVHRRHDILNSTRLVRYNDIVQILKQILNPR